MLFDLRHEPMTFKCDQQMKPKVAQLLFSGLGGHGSVAFSLLEGSASELWLNSLGFLGVEPLLAGYSDYCEAKGIPYRYFRAVPGKPFLKWPEITSWLFRVKPDVILLHSVKALLPCLLYGKLFGKPLIVVEHQANALKTRQEWWVTRLSMICATRVVYLTENYAAEVHEKIGRAYRSEKVEVIANGVDINKFSPGERDILADRTVRIGMAARFTTMRRQDLLVEAIEALVHAAPDLDWRLSLAGDGTTLEAVRNLIVQKKLESRVTITGHLNEPELLQWFRGLDLYVHASKGETLSTAILQAMACGLPVVASNVAGIRNLLAEQPRFGCLVGQQNGAEFAVEIERLVRARDNARAMGGVALRIAREKYSHHRMAAEYVELVDRVRKC